MRHTRSKTRTDGVTKASSLVSERTLRSKSGGRQNDRRVLGSNETHNRKSNNGDLCLVCAGIPFNAIFVDRQPQFHHCFSFGTVEGVLQREKDYECPFCAFLVAIYNVVCEDYVRWDGSMPAKSDTIFLHAVSESWCRGLTITPVGRVRSGSRIESLPTAWISIDSEATAGDVLPELKFCVSKVTSAVSIDDVDQFVLPRKRQQGNDTAGWLNLDSLQAWRDICNSQHACACRHGGKSKPTHRDIKLLDTTTLSLVSGKGSEPYAALSYVWGATLSRVQSKKHHLRSTSRDLTSASLPATIRDAIQCASLLGLQYIWIDQYCIDQFDEDQKRIQINMMDLVYESADVVIVALDGASIDAGLAGISKPFKYTNQPIFKLNELEIMATYIYSLQHNEPHEPWNTRAWTIQEGLLARRCIFFGANNVRMQCEEEMFHDLLPVNLSSERVQFESMTQSSSGAMGIDLKGEEWDFEVYASLINRFTYRKLTDPNDVQNACKGVLNKLTRNTGTLFYQGLPDKDILRALLWEPSPFICMKRRPKFPSWTWMGWIWSTGYDPWLVHSTSTPARPMISHYDEKGMETTRNYNEVCAAIPEVRPYLLLEATVQFSDPAHLLSSAEFSEHIVTISSLVAIVGLKLIRESGSAVKKPTTWDDDELVALGDHWTIVDSAGAVLSNFAFSFQGSREAVFEQRDYFFHTHRDISELLVADQDDVVAANLVFIKHWPAVRCDKESDSWLFDMVSALVIVRNEDGTAWRLAAVLLTMKQWTNMKPSVGVVKLC